VKRRASRPSCVSQLELPVRSFVTDNTLWLSSAVVIAEDDRRDGFAYFVGCSRAMTNGDHEDREQDVRERIASLIRATEQARKKQITGEELQRLKAAASRLDELLNAGADADRQALKSAAARLDQLLSEIGTGKDVSSDLKRRRDWRGRDE